MALYVLYAITDEVHQLFIAGRAGQVRDVLIDSVSASDRWNFTFLCSHHLRELHVKKVEIGGVLVLQAMLVNVG